MPTTNPNHIPNVLYLGERTDIYHGGPTRDIIIWRDAEMDTRAFTLDTFRPNDYPGHKNL